MCRSSGTEIYDLAWSPDAAYFIIGSMDNIARIYNAGSGKPPRTGTTCAGCVPVLT
jgi:WD40 repeat protein